MLQYFNNSLAPKSPTSRFYYYYCDTYQFRAPAPNGSHARLLARGESKREGEKERGESQYLSSLPNT